MGRDKPPHTKMLQTKMDQYTASGYTGPGSAQGVAKEAEETPQPTEVHMDLSLTTCEALGLPLMSLPASFTLVGVDFNAVPDPLGDVSVESSSTRCPDLRALKLGQICVAFAMPSGSGTRIRVPTFAAHHTEARIDLVWVPATNMMKLRSVRILPRGIFDHTPLMADWGAGHQAHRLTWRLNAWYLKSPECAEFVEEELKAFFRCLVD
ncbi:hypothetical protein NDU88_004651 [Pleurodeles waltl]|uniref:Uncharacterized protein n=1 Tax=Pleurodeles waltl TaxID=8319 RepID=A0AAV7M833_PLEWA|nr:hypothetical protein NDU88_004651 [Pleurodeles waltl]